MRADAFGFFWQDVPAERGKNATARVMPEIPATGWTAPREFPRLTDAPYLSIDVETKELDFDHGPGWARGKGHIVGVSIGSEGRNWYFPVRHEVCANENLDPAHVFPWLREVFSNPLQPKIGANLLYDVGWLSEEGINVAGQLYDVQFAEALLEETARTSLDELGRKYLGEGKETNLLYQWCADYYGGKVGGEQRSNIWRAPPSLVGHYAEGDVDLPARILPLQWARLSFEGLLPLFHTECDLIPLLIAMRRAGACVDTGRAEEVKARLGDAGEVVQQRIRNLASMDVNVNAPESIKRAFESCGIPVPLTAKGNPTFTKETLGRVEHPLAEAILEKRKIAKVADTFVDSYILKAHVNGRVFCQFHPLRGDDGGTRSGRFASSDPNLQNVPSRDEELAPLVRGLFIPDPGHVRWIRYDYSQIEYRFLAHFAQGDGADALRQRYCEDPETDYHVFTQQLVEHRTGQRISRKPIKNINFGLIYGMGIAKLTRSLGLEEKAGRELFDAYHEAAPFAKATMDHYANQALSHGYVTTILGRRSRFDLWEPDDRDGGRFRRGGRGEGKSPPLPYAAALGAYGRIKRAMSYKALNRVLQGSAADLMKVAMLKCWREGVFSVTGVPRLTVHDELDFSDPGNCDEAFAYIKHVMETVLPLRIPVLAELEAGPSWGTVA